MVVFAHLGSSQLTCLVDFADFFVSQANNYIFWLKVGMNHLAHSMHIVEANKALFCKSSYERKGNTFVVVSFNNLQEINTQDLKHHYEVLSVWTMMDERV
jgi:hypothetical protein